MIPRHCEIYCSPLYDESTIDFLISKLDDRVIAAVRSLSREFVADRNTGRTNTLRWVELHYPGLVEHTMIDAGRIIRGTVRPWYDAVYAFRLTELGEVIRLRLGGELRIYEISCEVDANNNVTVSRKTGREFAKRRRKLVNKGKSYDRNA